MVKNKFAFSILEFIASLLVVAFIVAIVSYGLHKINPLLRINKQGLSGAFACYYDDCDDNNENCELRQILYENNNIKEDKDVTSIGHCNFTYGKRLNRVFVIATGAGSEKNSGQVKTDFAPHEFEQIIPGRANGNYEDGKTILSGLVVLPGQTSDNGLQYENIESCEIISSPDRCPHVLASDSKMRQSAEYNEKDVPVGCELLQNDDGSTYVKINGCNFGEGDIDYNTILLSDLKRVKGFLDRLDKNSLSDIGKSQKKNIYSYTYNNLPTENNTFKFNFRMKDSTYDSRVNLSIKNGSHMEDILSNMSSLKQNRVINQVLQFKPGAPKKNGAVVIIW